MAVSDIDKNKLFEGTDHKTETIATAIEDAKSFLTTLDYQRLKNPAYAYLTDDEVQQMVDLIDPGTMASSLAAILDNAIARMPGD